MEVGGTEAGCFLRESVEVDGGEWLRLRVAEGKQASVTSLPLRGALRQGGVPCPGNARWAPEQAQADIPTAKIDVTSKPPVGDISVVTLIRTDTTLDHSQKAEKV